MGDRRSLAGIFAGLQTDVARSHVEAALDDLDARLATLPGPGSPVSPAPSSRLCPECKTPWNRHPLIGHIRPGT